LVVLAAVGVRPADLGWRFVGTLRHGWVYAGLFVIALPFVIAMSGSAEFQEHYPILEIVPGQTGVWRDLAIWWPFYAAQFVAIETFFRGVLVLGLSERFGSSAVLIAVVPYMMIHFVKPPAEAAASIIGGVVLGYLALRTRSIVWGIALHITVAASMDIAALGHKGFLW
jgi:membrane protease YdiL (CAAX protease family)